MAAVEFTRFVTLPDGCRLALHHFVNGRGRPNLLLLHANGLPASTYRQLIRVFLEEFEVYALDLRGQGDATQGPPNVSFGLAQHAQDVLHLIADLGIRGCVVFGHSLGGGTALKAEEMRRGTFGKIAVYEPTLLAERVPRTDERLQRLAKGASRRRRRFPSHQAAIEAFRRKPNFASFTSEALADYVRYGFRRDATTGEIELKTTPEAESKTFLDVQNTRFAGLAVLSCPVLIGYGRRTAEHEAVHEAVVAAAQSSAAQPVKFEGVGHFAPFEDPRRIGLRFLTFYKEAHAPYAKM